MKFTFSATQPTAHDVARISFVKGAHDQVLQRPNGIKAIEMGMSAREPLTRRKFLHTIRQTIILAKAHHIPYLALRRDDFLFPHLALSDKMLAEMLVVNLMIADYEFVRYKTKTRGGLNAVKEFILVGATSEEFKSGVREGQLIAKEVNACRSLANTRAADLTPSGLAHAAQEAVQGLKVKVSVLGKKEMADLSMVGILQVAKGSAEEPKCIIMEYRGGESAEKPILLVGKGVTYDSGGINLKIGDAFQEIMHLDMAGGAAVVHTLALAARLKLKKNVVGIVPAAENMPSGASLKPGDIIKTMAGITVEVTNTDAEGRIILADALTFAKRYKPKLVVDVATLTSAAIAALGQKASAIFTRDTSLLSLVQRLGEESGDYVWPLPLWEEYEQDIKSAHADLTAGRTKFGGACAAAAFLSRFTRSYPWIHIDIAPRMTATDSEYLAKGATGEPVKLLIKLLAQY